VTTVGLTTVSTIPVLLAAPNLTPVLPPLASTPTPASNLALTPPSPILVLTSAPPSFHNFVFVDLPFAYYYIVQRIKIIITFSP